MTDLLTLDRIRAGYGQSLVLQDVSLSVREGEVVCLIGANGAGKTTTTRILAGLLKQWSGQVLFDGKPIDDIPAHERVELGIALSPEGRQVFPHLTVHDNLLLGSYSKRARAQRAQSLPAVYDLFPKLAERREQKAGLMSGGEQQMLAIGRALMARPRLLMLDEPSLGLAPKIILDVYRAIAQTAALGISILFVEQNVHAALSIAHRGYVLANGRVVLGGSAAELGQSKLVQEAFLARRKGERRPAHSPGSAAMTGLLEIRGLNRSFGGLRAIVDVTLDVAQGQFLGIIGANGAGKTTLLNLITGYLKPTSGTIHFEGRPIHGLPPYRIARFGVGRTFQVVQPFAEMSVRDNVMTGALFSRNGDKRSLAQARQVCEAPLRHGRPREPRRAARRLADPGCEEEAGARPRAGDRAQAPAAGRGDGRADARGDRRSHPRAAPDPRVGHDHRDDRAPGAGHRRALRLRARAELRPRADARPA